MDFALGVLARVSEGQKAAAAAEKRRRAAEAAARHRALEERKQREKERIREDVARKMLRTLPKKRISKRRVGAAKAKARKLTPEEMAMKMRGKSPQKLGGPSGVARERAKKPSGPPKPLDGMEFVERRDKKKEIKVPHTSDYSDLFGDDYLVGIDLKCVKKMKEESAKATKEAQKIIAEQKALKQKRLREAEELSKMSEEMKRRGLKEKHQNEWRLKATEKDWIAVDVPTSALTPRERAKLKTTASSSSQASGVGSSTSAGVRVTKAKKAQFDAADIARKKAALRQCVLAATGGSPAAKPRRARSPSSSPERRPTPSRKRRRTLEDDRRAPERRSYDDRRTERRPRDDRRSDRRSYDDWEAKKPRYEDRNRGYNSEEWDDDVDDDDDDSEEDLFGIEALDREEERSARLAAEEDKRERKLELQRKKEKERRREQFESGRH